MKKIILLIFVVVNLSGLYAQQESQYTQYMYNTMSINPGYTGTRGVLSILGLYRAQWIGLDGAPKTASFSAHTPINFRGDGIGLNIENDQIGPSEETSFNVSYAYALPISHDMTLSLGISGGGNAMRVDYNKLKLLDPDSNLEGVLNKFYPNIGAGVYLHSEKWYTGISVPSILETKFYDDVKQSVASTRMHFYAMGGYVMELNEEIKFKPAALISITNGAPVGVDLSANFLFNEKFTVGAAYRWDAALSALAGFQVTDGLYIGYAYDYDTNNLGRYNSGSHEVFLRFELIASSSKRILTPRFF